MKRTILRNRARNKLKQMGVPHLNRDNGKGSIFAANWRFYA